MKRASKSPTAVVFVAVFIDLVGFGIVLPLLPSYAAQYHVTDAVVGALVASFSLMQFVFAPLWGKWSDRVGRRPVLIIGLAGSAVSYLIFALASSFWALLLSRVVAGGMGATVNVAQAYLADVTPPERRARAMGLIGAAFGLGFVIGPALGGISSRWGTAAPGLVAATLAAINCVFALSALPETRVHVPTDQPRTPVHWKGLVEPFTVMGLTTVAFTVMYVVFPLQVERRLGYNRHEVAYLFVLVGLVNVAVQGGLVGRLVPRFGERKLMIVGAMLMALGLAGLGVTLDGAPLAEPLMPLLGSLLFLAFGPGLIGPSVTGYVSRVVPAEEQGRALGALQGVGAVARVVGPILAGFLTHALGARTAFTVAAVASVLAAGAPLVMKPERPKA